MVEMRSETECRCSALRAAVISIAMVVVPWVALAQPGVVLESDQLVVESMT